MKRPATTAALLTLFLAIPTTTRAQVQWTDRAGGTHITAEMPKQDQVTPQEWARLQKQMEEAKAAAADTSGLPAPNAGIILTWTGTDGVTHHTNVPPGRNQVTDAEWKRLEAEIPRLNAAPTAPGTTVAPAAAPAEPPATGDMLPDLPAGGTLMWTDTEGRGHMTSVPPRRSQVTAIEWKRLEGAIDVLRDEAGKAAPPSEPAAEPSSAPAPAAAAAEPAAPTGTLGGDGSLSLSCSGTTAQPGTYRVTVTVRNETTDQVARDTRVRVTLLDGGSPIPLEAHDPIDVPPLYPGRSTSFKVDFALDRAVSGGALTCSAEAVSTNLGPAS